LKKTTVTIEKINYKNTNKYKVIIIKSNLQWTEVIDIVKDEV